MNLFEKDFIERQTITQTLLQTIRLIGEYKGKQDLFKEQAPQVLETLRGAAVIQSTESSNRIEGINVPLERIKKLIAEKTTPRLKRSDRVSESLGTRNRGLPRRIDYRSYHLRTHSFYYWRSITTASRSLPVYGGIWRALKNDG